MAVFCVDQGWPYSFSKVMHFSSCAIQNTIFWKLGQFVFLALYIPSNGIVNFSGRFSNGTRFYVCINGFYFSKFSILLYVSEYICIYCVCVLVIWDSVVFCSAWKPFPLNTLFHWVSDFVQQFIFICPLCPKE